MKALTITQPWASLIALGYKRVETRSWTTKHRGPLAIHASAGWTKADRTFAEELVAEGVLPTLDVPRGAVIALAELYAISPTEGLEISKEENRMGNFGPGRFAWGLSDVVAIEPVPAKGALGLWEWNRDG